MTVECMYLETNAIGPSCSRDENRICLVTIESLKFCFRLGAGPIPPVFRYIQELSQNLKILNAYTLLRLAGMSINIADT